MSPQGVDERCDPDAVNVVEFVHETAKCSNQ
jgi:hypothetical protein